MAAPVRTRLDLDARRAQLVAVGMQLFSERAYDEIAIDDIAAAAGISKGLLYHYFPSKRDFYVETVRQAAAQLVQATEPPADSEPLDALRHGLGAYLGYVETHRTGYVTLTRGGIGSDPEVRGIVDGARDAIAARMLAGLPGAPSELQRLAVRGWLGFVEAAALEWLERGSPSREAVRALCAQAFLGALAAAGG
ncbi:MAG: TetR/AcrR family transcriptional regulator [Solirubrobacteraceae bacterium]